MEQKPDNHCYSEDKPTSCEFCYFWGGKVKGCGLPECHYLLPEEPEDQETAIPGDCSTCPYGKLSPCIGYCLEKIQQELKVGRYAER